MTEPTVKQVSTKVVRGAEILMQIFEEIGPGSKTGLSGEIAHKLEKSVSPREFDEMVQYCRRVLGPRAGKAVVLAQTNRTFQYGFAETVVEAERYIILRNNRYAATRAETMAQVCDAALKQHGDSYSLAFSKQTHDHYAQTLRLTEAQYEAETAAQRWAKRTGLDAPVQLEERIT